MTPRGCRPLVAGLICLSLFTSVRAADATYTVQPGDTLAISVWKEPDLQGPMVLVRPDGTFSFPLVGQVDARGKSVTDLQQLITERLRKYISDPVVTVSVQEIKGNKVYVIGQVQKAGAYPYVIGLTVEKALALAGGLTNLASTRKIYLLHEDATGERRVHVGLEALVLPGDTVVIEEGLF